MKPEHARDFNLLEEWQLLGLCIEREAKGEPLDGKIAVGTVVLNRVKLRDWDGKTIHEVILKPWQFSWTMPEAGSDYYNHAHWIAANWVDAYRKNACLRECCRIANGLFDGTIPQDPDLAGLGCCQYLNPKTAKATKEKWLKAGMKVVKKIKNHEFFV